MKVDRVYGDFDTIVFPAQLPFWHCFEGNTVSLETLQWCAKHVLGYWAYWFDTEKVQGDDYTPQVAYIGFSNSIDLFMFRMACPNTITGITDLSEMRMM